jgi:pimeloyl-ACP methyl ester carboxylesterase
VTDWPDARTPFESGALLDVGGATVWYRDDGGPGEPLVLLGGFAPGHFHYDFVRPYLPEYRLVTWEPRGSGPSSLDGPFTVDAWVADLHGLVTALGLERPHIWANGFSTYIALAFAARHPEDVGSLITYTDVWAQDPGKGYAQAWEVYRATVEAHGTTGEGAKILSRLYSVSDPPWFAEWFAQSCAEVMHAETMEASRYCLLEADIRNLLPSVTAPLLVLLGDEGWGQWGAEPAEESSLALMRREIPSLEVAALAAHPIHMIVQKPRESAEAVASFLRTRARAAP